MLLNIVSLAAFLSLGYCQSPGQKVPLCELSKDVIVQFHGWKYSDIEAECMASSSRYYCAFQVHAPFEHQYASISFPPNAENPWWQRYHQIGWSIVSTDSGSEADYFSMLQTCNANNIRIYIDLEMNNAGDNSGNGYGSSGGYYDGEKYQFPHFNGQTYYHLPDTAAPNGCPTTSGVIEDFFDPVQIRHCNRLSVPLTSMTSPVPELCDLKTSLSNVRNGYIEEMDLLLNGVGDAERGIAGFRLAHARWVDPADLRLIINSLEDIKIPGTTNVRPFVYSEVFPDAVISETEYYDFGNVEEIRAGPLLSDIVRMQHPNYRLANLTLWGVDMGLMAGHDAIVFIDDPASQRGWPDLTNLDQTLRYDDVRNYQTANAFMLAHPYGYPRVHSSYHWNKQLVNDGGVMKDVNDYMGPPRDVNGDVEDVIVESDGNSCVGDWNCEHRWLPIRGLARFRNLVKQAGADSVNDYWTNGYEQIAFSRGSAGFFVINNESNKGLRADIYTSMPPGSYCDLATGADPTASPCQGRSVVVNNSGRVMVDIQAGDPTPFIAIVAI